MIFEINQLSNVKTKTEIPIPDDKSLEPAAKFARHCARQIPQKGKGREGKIKYMFLDVNMTF